MDYTQIGLKCGIEIHQQLEGRKLFCDCPTTLRDDPPHFSIRRKLRATAGESGTIDIAARQEQLRNKTFIYHGYSDTTCLVEADAEPPHELNKDALYTSIQLCKLAEAKVSQIIQVMRKTVVDGSNTSGFQRTALVGRNGKISTSNGEVRIDNISLEEDACKIISETSDEKTYRLDRLGIPLIEIGTAPDIKTPEQCQETAKKIGYLLRSLPGVKRGLGTIRQDINVSIVGGNRIEIKGAQDLHLIPLYVELEVRRQQVLVGIYQHLQDQKIKEYNKCEMLDITDIFRNTESGLIKKTFEKKGRIIGARLPHFAGLLGKEVQPNRRFGTELSDYAKVHGVHGLIHSDEDLDKYKFSDKEISEIKTKLKIKPQDVFIIIADLEEKARRALEAAIHRANQQLNIAVPKEVRRANPDGTSSFMRPMPGASRMYPETDVPLIKTDLSNIKVPETLDQKIVRYQKDFGLSKDLAEFVAKSDKMPLFEELVKKYPGIKAAFMAETLTSTLLEIKRNYNLDSEKLKDDNFRDLFKYLFEDKIHKDIIIDVLMDMIKGEFDLKRYTTLSTEELHHGIVEVIKQNPGANFSALMGLCMKRFAGKAAGKFISDQLKMILEKGHK